MIGDSLFLTGAVASIASGLATGLGGLVVFATRSVPHRLQNGMLGFAAGVMLAATAFSLLLPAIEYGGGGVSGVLVAVVGTVLGAVFLDLLDHYAPHRHFIAGREGGDSTRLNAIWLFVIAITIHNFPEGLAVGVSFGDGDIPSGLAVAIAIGLQNVPEGLAVAVSLVREQYTTRTAFLVALATGAVEPVGGLIGLSVVQIAQPVLPYALAFAAGAMLWVVSDEIIPETHRDGGQRIATYAIVVGFVLMMFLDNAFG